MNQSNNEQKMRGCSSLNVTCQIMKKNQAIQKRHSKLFKSCQYSFCPSDDVVKLMSFEFIHTFKRINLFHYQANG